MYKITDRILSWIPEDRIEPEARQQLHNIAEMPFVFKHLAVMPDCHLGIGATVGSVIATDSAIIPAAVGVDIGCGMIAVRTIYSANQLPDDLRKIRLGIERRVPLGAGGANSKLTKSATERLAGLKQSAKAYYDKLSRRWPLTLGSLGSGNHFIELSLDEQDRVWIVLHSGSRGIGNQLANQHIRVAQSLMNDMLINLKDPNLAYLPAARPEFNEYITDLLWSQEFARLNREEMMDRVMTELSYAFFKEDGHQAEIEAERINCHHNFTQQEEHCLDCIDILGNDSLLLERLLADFEVSKARDFLAGCQFLRHSCGGLLLRGANGDPASSALPIDVLGRMQKYLLAHCQGLLGERNHFVLSGLCVCDYQNQTGAIKNTGESMSGQDSYRLFVEGKVSDKLGKLIIEGFYESLAYKKIVACSPFHRKSIVWITRKGAIQMRQGQRGVIPGSMGTKSYIVSGLENPLAFHSAPHGAGRRLSRNKARAQFTMEDFEKNMQGIECRHSAALLDELPGAYKNVDEVMEQSKELVRVEHTLRQIINVKGD